MQRRRLYASVAVVAATAIFAIVPTAHAQTWLGGTGNWSDPTMWSTGTVPAMSAVVNIDGGNTGVSSVVTRTASDPTFIGGLTIDAGDKLIAPSAVASSGYGMTVNGILEVSGSITGSAIRVGAPLIGTGEIRFTGSGTHSIDGLSGPVLIGSGLTVTGGVSTAYANNYGTLLADGAGQKVGITFDVGAPVGSNNYGTIRATNGASVQLDSVVNKPGGVISVESGSLRIVNNVIHPGIFANNGSLYATDSTVTIDNIPANGSVLSGFNLTRSAVTNNSGIPLGIASSTGTVAISGSAASQAGSHFSLALAAPGSADLLSLTGSLSLAADDYLDLSSLPGTLLNTPYTLMTASSISGTFDHVTPGYSVQYTPTSVIVTAVPEPAALAGLALFGVPALRRRRRTGRA